MLASKGVDRCLIQVPDNQFVSGPSKIGRHWATHVADTDISDTHFHLLIVSAFDFRENFARDLKSADRARCTRIHADMK